MIVIVIIIIVIVTEIITIIIQARITIENGNNSTDSADIQPK